MTTKVKNLIIYSSCGSITYLLFAHTAYGSIFHFTIGIITILLLAIGFSASNRQQLLKIISMIILAIITNLGITASISEQLNNDPHSHYVYVLNEQCQHCANTLNQPLVPQRQAIIIDGDHHYRYGNKHLATTLQHSIQQFNNTASQQRLPIIAHTPLLLKLDNHQHIIAVCQNAQLPTSLADHTAQFGKQHYRI